MTENAASLGVERHARRLLRAYPWRVRVEQGEEIVATVLDTLDPSARRIPWRDQLDVARGGLRMRRARRPDWGRYFWYAITGCLSARHTSWLIDDLVRPGYRRRATWRGAWVGAITALPIVLTSQSLAPLVWFAMGQALGRWWPGRGYETAVKAGLARDRWWLRPQPWLPRWGLGRLCAATWAAGIAAAWITWWFGPADFGTVELVRADSSLQFDLTPHVVGGLMVGSVLGMTGFIGVVLAMSGLSSRGGPGASAAPWPVVVGLTALPPIAVGLLWRLGWSDAATALGLAVGSIGIGAGASLILMGVRGLQLWSSGAEAGALATRPRSPLTLWDLAPTLAWRRPPLSLDTEIVDWALARAKHPRGVG